MGFSVDQTWDLYYDQRQPEHHGRFIFYSCFTENRKCLNCWETIKKSQISGPVRCVVEIDSVIESMSEKA